MVAWNIQFILYFALGNPLEVAVMAGKKCIGLVVGVVVLPASPRLYTPQALKVIGPRALGVDADYKEPQFLMESNWVVAKHMKSKRITEINRIQKQNLALRMA